MTTGRLPNIILIIVDTLRGDHVSCYGHERRTTPHLDALAADATLYTTAISPGAWTPSSHASIFTGTYPSRHGVDRSHPYLDGGLTTLPEYLRERGYRTFGISSNFWISTATNYDRGFDVFYQSWQLAQTRSNPALERQRRRDPSYSAGGNGRSAPERLGATINRLDAGIRRYCCRPFVNLDMGARRVNRVVRRWARTWKTLDAPFFAFLHYMEPHEPYRPPARFLRHHLGGQSARRVTGVNQHALKFMSGVVPMGAEEFDRLGRLYDAEVSYADHCIGELIEGLRATGLLDRTMLIVTSDHGENLGDHGLMSHMFSVHESILRVPLIVRYPGGEHGGTEPGLVQTLDIFPTLVTMLENGGAPAQLESTVRAQFQAGALPPFGPPRDVAIAELRDVQPPIHVLRKRYPQFDWSVYDRSLRAVRTATHKYIQGSDGREWLYDMATDPRELTDLHLTDPTRAAELRARLEAWEGTFAPAEVTEAPELDEEIRRRLRDLGYIED